jgi:hypothetical protein
VLENNSVLRASDPGENVEPNKGFVRAWFTWKRQPRPTKAFDSGRRNAPGYEVECDLDHLATWVYQLGTAHLSGTPRDYRTQSADLLNDVDGLEGRVQQAILPSEDRQEYLKYLEHVRQVLRALSACYESEGHRHDREG